jgi:hypothetical protein
MLLLPCSTQNTADAAEASYVLCEPPVFVDIALQCNTCVQLILQKLVPLRKLSHSMNVLRA